MRSISVDLISCADNMMGYLKLSARSNLSFGMFIFHYRLKRISRIIFLLNDKYNIFTIPVLFFVNKKMQFEKDLISIFIPFFT